MTQQIVHRPARITRPVLPRPEELLAPPPAQGEAATGSGVKLQMLLPVLGGLSAVVMIVVLRTSSKLFLVVGGVILIVALLSGVVMVAGQFGGGARARRTQRANYLDYLERTRTHNRSEAQALREQALRLDPGPADLVHVVRDPARRWERRRGDADFLSVRVGTGSARLLGCSVPPEQNPVLPYDPTLFAEAVAVARHGGTVAGVPIRVNLDGAGQVGLVGPRPDVLGVARSMLLQLACLHAPDDVSLAVVHPPEATADWAGVDLLPHLVADGPADGLAGGSVAARRVARTTDDLARLLAEDLHERAEAAADRSGLGQFGMGQFAQSGMGRLGGRRLVVFVDDGDQVARPLPLPAGAGLVGCRVTEIHLVTDRLHEPSDTRVRLSLADGAGELLDTRDTGDADPAAVRVGEPDQTPATVLEGMARTLSGLRLSRTDLQVEGSADPPSAAALLRIPDVDALTPELAWQPRPAGDFLRVPIGLDDAGEPVLLDLKESAHYGMGPHGLCVGATGSGKSELLRTLITALTCSHAPEDLSIVLVDYKGGAAFAPYASLPHVAGLIDNLADDAQLTARARASINGEVIRRQRMLRDAGSSPSITHYRELRRDRPELPPMPHLLIVIDEFGELLSAEPDFVDLLITIGRIGRSIGVHLLLSSQRLEAGRLRGLETYLSYRIGLRTFSEAESSMVLETPDAFHLPPLPGFGYLKVDTTQYRRFRAAFVSGPVAPAQAGPDPAPVGLAPMVLPHYGTVAEALTSRTTTSPAPGQAMGQATGPTLATRCVERLQAPGRAVSPVWLRPLPKALALGDVPPPADQDDAGHLDVVIGLLDDPSRQRQEPWVLDLARAGGHVAVIGAPHSGRTTLLRTLAAGIASSHDPRRVSVYGIDATGAGLASIAGFPQVGGVATRGQADRLSRVLEELLGMLAERERIFREREFDSMESFRREHRAGRVPELRSADVVLLVDGFGPLRTDFEAVATALLELLERGAGYGIHVVLTLTRWNELRMAQQSLVGTRIELHLNDPIDSVIGRRLAETITAEQPGRALTDRGLFAQIALPAPAGGENLSTQEGLRRLVDESGSRLRGPAAMPIRQLPLVLDPRAIPADTGTGTSPGVAVGVRQDTMAAARIELGVREQHLLVFGDPGAGKTTLLRGLLEGMCAQCGDEELVVALIDPRGELGPSVPEAYLGGRAATAVEARRLTASIAAELERRASHRDAVAGSRIVPRIVLVADDYDLVAGADPLQPLLGFLPAARDLGLNVLLSRPVAGSGRAMYDLTMQAVRETGASSFIMSGERSEGALLPRVYAEPLPVGRGRLLRRGDPAVMVQVAAFTTLRV